MPTPSRALRALFLSLAVSAFLIAREPQLVTDQGSARTQEILSNLSFEPIGPGDLVTVYVAESAEMTRSYRISSDGTLSIPLLKKPILVTGLLATDIEKAVATQISEEKILVNPVVSVTVAEYRSKPVDVAGAVTHPVTIQAVGHLRLLDAIAKADGLTSEAGSEILVSRIGPNGSAEAVQHIPIRELLNGSNPSLNVFLHGGESVSVPRSGKIYIVGNVKNPGVFSISEGNKSTVLQALALCQGLLPYAQTEAVVYRVQPGTSTRQEITIPVREIMKRRAPDVQLESNDVLYFPENAGKRLSLGVVDRLTGFGSSTVSGLLIFK